MTTYHSTQGIQDQPSGESEAPVSNNPNLVEVSLNYLVADLLPRKGLFAVFPAFNDEIVIGSMETGNIGKRPLMDSVTRVVSEV